MNWAAIAVTALSLVPAGVQAAETIITEAGQGTAKKQLVIDSISAATGIADNTLTGTDKAAADAISVLLSKTIDSIAGLHKVAGSLKTAQS